MVLTKAELIGSLQHEVNILVHLAGKLDATSADYRPTAKQRSSVELLRYLTLMGPGLVTAAKTGTFDREAWGAKAKAAEAKTLDELIQDIESQKAFYAEALGAMSDDDFRGEIEMFGTKTTRGAFIVNMVLSGHAAYRTQLFCYLKACGREELGTSNLWRGVDPVPAA
jgi:hypothetical protein